MHLVSPTPSWLKGPLVMAGAIAMQLLIERWILRVPFPFEYFECCIDLVIIYSAFSGGVRGGMLSIGLILGYLALVYSQPGAPFRLEAEETSYLLLLAVASTGMVMLVSALKWRSDRTAQADAELLTVNQQLQAQAQLAVFQEEFFASVSHELRTPLTAIKSAVSIVESGRAGPTTDQQRRFLGIAKGEADRLHALVDDLLDMQRLSQGNGHYEMADADLNEIVAHVSAAYEHVLTPRGVVLKLELGEGRHMASVDRKRVEQVLLNLMSNAGKFTGTGSTVTIRTELAGAEVRVLIRDEGKGIAAEDLARLFQRFVQLDNKQGGTGLGLAISRRIIEDHHGSIWAESTPGRGSTFAFALPVVG